MTVPFLADAILLFQMAGDSTEHDPSTAGERHIFWGNDIKSPLSRVSTYERTDLNPEFDDIYSEVGPALYRYLRRLTGSRALAEDILQETFLKLHTQLTARATISHHRGWLFQVATNLTKDEKRHEIRSAVREENFSAPPTVIDFQAKLEKQQIVRRTLEQLTPRMRQVLLLFAEGFTYREISEISGVEAAYVGVLMQRARATFKQSYEEDNGRKRGEQYRSNSL
jgi:RNA polymerase sigma factor (sigma-70 family)